MRAESIARNYAGALFALAEKNGNIDAFTAWVEALAGAIHASPKVEAALLSPKVPKAAKTRLLTGAVAGAPGEFVHFLAAVVKRGRQVLLPAIATEFHQLNDVRLNRVRAGVILAREPDEQLKNQIKRTLEERLGKEVIPSFSVDPEILGGAIVRLGDRVLDGSVKRRIVRLRRQLLGR
ncbi:MAG TPA: ATP synthase F1 subunit delta [Gemmatimonadales bacterium]|nr:ATP synthase F1 subunit delta [Gemmatimonadales bacterium]